MNPIEILYAYAVCSRAGAVPLTPAMLAEIEKAREELRTNSRPDLKIEIGCLIGERDQARDERNKMERDARDEKAEKFKALDLLRKASTQRDEGLVREQKLNDELVALKNTPSYTLQRLADFEATLSDLRSILGHGGVSIQQAARNVVHERDEARSALRTAFLHGEDAAKLIAERDKLRDDLAIVRRILCAKT